MARKKKRGQGARKEGRGMGGFLRRAWQPHREAGRAGREGRGIARARASSAGSTGKLPKGVYGFTIRTNIGEAGNRDGGVKVEPFGNVRKDSRPAGRPSTRCTEPPVDVFEEAEHVLVVVEMPGIGEDDLRLELRDDILTIAAEKGPRNTARKCSCPEQLRPRGDEPGRAATACSKSS